MKKHFNILKREEQAHRVKECIEKLAAYLFPAPPLAVFSPVTYSPHIHESQNRTLMNRTEEITNDGPCIYRHRNACKATMCTVGLGLSYRIARAFVF